MITSVQLKDVVDRVDALYKYLNIDQKKVEFEEEQLRTQAPDFWEDVERAQEQMKKVKSIEKWIVGYNNVKQNADELQLAFDFYKEELVTEQEVDDDYKKTIKAIEDLELMNMLRQEEDPMDCVLKINSVAAEGEGNVIGREYYNLQGQRIAAPTQGVYLEKVLTDKGVVTYKRMK